MGFDNTFTRALPADPVRENTRRQVRGAVYSWVKPTPVKAPRLVAYAKEVAALLDFSEDFCESEEFVHTFSGNQLMRGMQPYATCYGGDQFGHWAGQLGDGRAINLGELVNLRGERWALQLKGAGPTPYSRQADGLAVLRSSIREFLCSEAMHHLGVPTTRALSLITTGEAVVRDILYDGRPRPEPGAVVCRVAPSFTRFGHFQIHAAWGDLELLKKLIDYTIRTDFPALLDTPDQAIDHALIARWFTEVCTRTAEMIIHWMRVGFVHGVMNTDNMSILGLTIDYGPYGWLENYDPDWTPNTTDAQHKRYRFGHQPQIAYWNLVQLAQSLATLTENVGPLQFALEQYAEHFQSGYNTMMASKLGLKRYEASTDESLISDLLALLQTVETDMTLFFRCLATPAIHAENSQADEWVAALEPAYYPSDERTDAIRQQTLDWLHRYRHRLNTDPRTAEERQNAMNGVNPKYVLRNYLAQLAIDQSEQGDHSAVWELLDTLRHPYTDQAGKAHLAEKRPDWARHRAGCSMLSCSS